MACSYSILIPITHIPEIGAENR